MLSAGICTDTFASPLPSEGTIPFIVPVVFADDGTTPFEVV